jgi:hypothetical protein
VLVTLVNYHQLKLVACKHPTAHGMRIGPYYRHVDSALRSDVLCSIDVRMAEVTTVPAIKFSLTPAIGLVAMTTLRTGPTGVAWIDVDDRYACQPGLIASEILQLEESPSRMLGSFLAINRNPLPDAFQILEDDPGSGCLGLANEPFADTVVLGPPEVCLAFADLSQTSPGRLGATMIQICTPSSITLTYFLDLATRKNFARGVCGKVNDSKIDSDGVRYLQRWRFRQVDGAKQVELLVSIDQISLSFDASLKSLLISTAHKGHPQTTRQGPQAYLSQTFEAQDALVVGDGSVWFEGGAPGPVALEDFDCFSDGPNCHLRGQAKTLTDTRVSNPVQIHLAEVTRRESLCGSKGSRFIESLHGAQKVGLLCFRGQ